MGASGQGQFNQLGPNIQQMGQGQMSGMMQGQQLQQGNQGQPSYAMQGGPQQGMAGPWQENVGQQGGGGGGGGGGASHSEEHRRQVLKQQQQRLLLLRHASKCPHDYGRCPVTPHCGSMKHLWKHIMTCKDQVSS